MSLFSEYISEARGMSIVELDDGFATFRIAGEECYVEDVFVRANKRRSRHASQLVDVIKDAAKSAGCKSLITTIDCLIKDPTTSLKACLRYGFNIDKCLTNIIILRMEIV